MVEQRAARRDQRRIEEASFIIVDFETVTPKGYPPEPIELGAMRITTGLQIDHSYVVSRLIKPPEHAPLTTRDTQQTGIRWYELRDQPAAEAILAEFEALMQDEDDILVAHHASYEAAIVQRYAQTCPRIAAMPWIDTVALAKHLVPGLANYTLDTLATHFALPIPVARHRALPDVELTVEVFLRVLEARVHASMTTIADLCRMAGLRNGSRQHERPVQRGLFEMEHGSW